MVKEKLIAKIPFEFASEDEVWIAIEPHIHKDEVVGFYLISYEDLSIASTYDSWFKELEQAQKAALENYGVDQSDWIRTSL